MQERIKELEAGCFGKSLTTHRTLYGGEGWWDGGSTKWQSNVWILDAWFAGTSWSANLKGTGWAAEAWAEGRSWGTRKWEVKTSGHIWALILKFSNSPGLWAFSTLRNLPNIHQTKSPADAAHHLCPSWSFAATATRHRCYGAVPSHGGNAPWLWGRCQRPACLKVYAKLFQGEMEMELDSDLFCITFTMFLKGTNWDYWSLITCFIIFPWFLFTNLADFALFRKLCVYFL